MALESIQNVNGSYPIIDLLSQCSTNNYNETFIVDLNNTVFGNDHLTNDVRMKLAFEKLNDFFEHQNDYKNECLNLTLPNGWSLNEFMDVGLLVSLLFIWTHIFCLVQKMLRIE